jgi:hypothetical protein
MKSISSGLFAAVHQEAGPLRRVVRRFYPARPIFGTPAGTRAPREQGKLSLFYNTLSAKCCEIEGELR